MVKLRGLHKIYRGSCTVDLEPGEDDAQTLLRRSSSFALVESPNSRCARDNDCQGSGEGGAMRCVTGRDRRDNNKCPAREGREVSASDSLPYPTAGLTECPM